YDLDLAQTGCQRPDPSRGLCAPARLDSAPGYQVRSFTSLARPQTGSASMPNAPTDFLRRLEEFADDTAHALERVQQELREIDVLIRQSTAEVERLAQRKIQIDTKVRIMAANLEGTPREDIRALYTAAQEAQLRLFMMRSQVEQLQSKQRTLEKYAQDLQRFLELSRFTPRELALLENGRPSSHDSPAASNSSITRIIEA